jgi:signal transduction histidine kinase/ActR/RegA family two-component response regulator/PAS domain-containing protein
VDDPLDVPLLDAPLLLGDPPGPSSPNVSPPPGVVLLLHPAANAQANRIPLAPAIAALAVLMEASYRRNAPRSRRARLFFKPHRPSLVTSLDDIAIVLADAIYTPLNCSARPPFPPWGSKGSRGLDTVARTKRPGQGLHRSRTRLEASVTPFEDRRKSFEQVLLHLREPLLLATRSGRILASNVAGAEALGTSVAALDGASLSNFSPEPQRLDALLAAAPVDQAPAAFPLRARDGRRFFCDASVLDPEILLLRLSGGPESEPRMRVFYETLSRLQGITAGVSDELPLEEITRTLLANGMASLGATTGGLFLVDESGVNLELKGQVGYQEQYVDRYRLVPLGAVMPLTDAFNRGAGVFTESAEDLTALYPEYAAAHPEIMQRALACSPLQLDGRPIGAIAMGFPLPWTFSDDDRIFLHALSLRCAQVLERLSGSEPTSRKLAERSASQLARLHAFTGALAQALTLAQVVEAVVDMGMVATSARAGGLWLLSDDGKSVSLVRNVGPTGPTAEKYSNIPLDAPTRMPILDAIRTGNPVWIESCHQLEERYPATFRAFSRGLESSLACLPLFAQGRCIGGLVFAYEGVRRFLEDERALLQVLSWHSAQAIERSRLYAAEKKAREAAEAIALDNERLYRDARQAHQRKDEFLAMLGHELRNPLAPILTALELMDLQGNSAFARERTTIARQVRHVVRLVDDLLDVSRITSGKIQLSKQRVEVAEVIAEAVEMASPLLEERFQNFTLSAPATGLPVMADRGRLAQAIANLLTNAAKYTEPRGTIDVTAEARGSEVLVRVRDSGIGIAPETLPRIFDLFVQERGSLDRAQGGLGIGLTVVRSLLHLHDGSVEAKSAGLGQGSEFVVRLPLGPDQDPEPAPEAMPEANSGEGVRRRVLIVDDNLEAAGMLATLLEAHGHDTSVAGDGPSALAIAPAFRPDVALLDIGLPVMDGYELARRLRGMDGFATTRLVAITGYGQASDKRSSHDAGFDEHLVKPVNVDTLIKILSRSVESSSP